MSRGWKGTLLKFGGEVGEGRVHTEDTFSVPLGSFQPGWPTSPTQWPNSLSERVPSVCALTGPHWPPLPLWVFLPRSCREACGGALLNMILPLWLDVTQDGVELSDPPLLTPWSAKFYWFVPEKPNSFLNVYTLWGEGVQSLRFKLNR